VPVFVEGGGRLCHGTMAQWHNGLPLSADVAEPEFDMRRQSSAINVHRRLTYQRLINEASKFKHTQH